MDFLLVCTLKFILKKKTYLLFYCDMKKYINGFAKFDLKKMDS